MDEQFQQAMVLHSRPYRENSAIVDFLTEKDGRQSSIVRLGSNKKNQIRSIVQPFVLLEIALKGKAELKHVVHIESSQSQYQFPEDNIYSAMYINELLVRLLPKDIACYELWQQYRDILTILSQTIEFELHLRQFERTLLAELGTDIDFSLVVSNKSSDVKYYRYIAEQGLVADLSLTPASYLYAHDDLFAITQRNFASSNTVNTYKRLMRQILNQYLGTKPLMSRQLFLSTR